ncbi:MAG: hypothetical protein ACI4O7_11975 [Aristaeellaceae bacterium]
MNRQIIALASDGEHVVMWDVDALLADCRGRQPVTVETARLIPGEWLTIDRDYAMTTDVTRPILAFGLPGRRLFIADGNHRLFRAAAEHVPFMQVVVLDEDEHLRRLYRSSEDTYRQVLDALAGENIFIDDFRP